MRTPSAGLVPAEAAAPILKSGLSRLVENGTHVLFGTEMAAYADG